MIGKNVFGKMAALILVAFAMIEVPSARGAEVYLESIKGRTAKISITISGFGISKGLESEGRTLQSVLEADIRRSAVFSLLDAPRTGERDLLSPPGRRDRKASGIP